MAKVIPKCFFRVSLKHNIIVENKRWMNITFYLPTKYNFFSLFINISLSLKSPIAGFSKIIIHFLCGYVRIIRLHQRCIVNKDVLSESLAYEVVT